MKKTESDDEMHAYPEGWKKVRVEEPAYPQPEGWQEELAEQEELAAHLEEMEELAAQTEEEELAAQPEEEEFEYGPNGGVWTSVTWENLDDVPVEAFLATDTSPLSHF